MYNVKIVNDYHFGVTVALGGETVAPGGGTGEFDNWGTTHVDVPGMGSIFFLDLGDKKMARYTNPKIPWTEKTWGGLIRFQGLDAYFRYEGQGQVTATIDQYGSLQLEFAQGGMVIEIPDLTVVDQAAAAEG